jgi:quercetin dioxygenase-like cupin family protein
MCKAVEIGKKGDAPRYHPGIKHLIKKNPDASLIKIDLWENVGVTQVYTLKLAFLMTVV